MDTLFEVADVLFGRHALQRCGHRCDVRLHPVSFEFEIVRLRGRQHLVPRSNALQSLLALVWKLRQHQSLFVMHNAREARWNGTLLLSHFTYANNIIPNQLSLPNGFVSSLAVKSVLMQRIEAADFPCRLVIVARRRSRAWVVSCGRVLLEPSEPSEPSELPLGLPSEFPSLVCLLVFL